MNYLRRINSTAIEQAHAEQVARVRRAIVTLAWHELVACRITATDYHTRIERANVKGPQAPYYGLR